MSLKRVPMPAGLLCRREELERIRAELMPEVRERMRLAALRSNRYLLHEIALCFSRSRAAAV